MVASPTIVLVRPPMLVSRSAVNTNTIAPPMNVAYLAGALRQRGYAPVVVDGCGLAPDVLAPLEDLPYLVQGLSIPDLIARIPSDVRLLGVSCMFSREWYLHIRVLTALREAFPHALIVAGGEHITAEPEVCLRACPALDVCVLGEGEATLVAIADALACGTSVEELPGTVVRTTGGQLRHNAKRARLRAIDDIAWPDWADIPVETYLSRHCAMDEHVKRTLPMLASRGCPYQCTFCSNPVMWGVNWFARAPENIVDEIAHYQRTYAIDHVEFYDLTTILDRKWVRRFTQALIDRNLGVSWTMPPGTRSEALDAEMLDLMARSGCTGITYAPESGSPETLAQIKKKVDLRKMLASMTLAVQSGLQVKINVIFGLPDQSLRDGWETFRFAARTALAGASDLLVFPFNPYPGSELYRRLVDAGRIDPSSPDHPRFLLAADYGDTCAVRSWSDSLSARAVLMVSMATMGMFYGLQMLRRPVRGLQLVVNLVRGKPATWLERMLLGQARRATYRRAGRTQAASPLPLIVE
jgi:anaerobic magnesium-protoporphyrin IX monomethyl ester cyclase